MNISTKNREQVLLSLREDIMVATTRITIVVNLILHEGVKKMACKVDYRDPRMHFPHGKSRIKFGKDVCRMWKRYDTSQSVPLIVIDRTKIDEHGKMVPHSYLTLEILPWVEKIEPYCDRCGATQTHSDISECRD